MEKEIVCSVCETEFTLIHEEEDTPMYCSFCGNSLDEDKDDDLDWNDRDED
jgi:predicted amidophosphoribosyltransferase